MGLFSRLFPGSARDRPTSEPVTEREVADGRDQMADTIGHGTGAAGVMTVVAESRAPAVPEGLESPPVGADPLPAAREPVDGEATADGEPAAPAATEDDAERLAVGEQLAELGERLDALASRLDKLGREQFRATNLLEGQGVSLDELADALREHRDGRERETAELRRALAELKTEARLGVVRDLLLVADGLAQSARVAQDLAAELRSERAERGAPAATVDEARQPFRAWLAKRGGENAAPDGGPAVTGGAVDRPAAIEAWLQGLLLVERRLLAVFERAGVQPIPTVGERFDPHRHLAVAVDASSDAPDGTVVGEELRGYLVGDRVLRHAEVVVARGDVE